MKAGRYLIAIVCLCLSIAARPACAQTAKPPVNTLEGLVVGIEEGDRVVVNSFGTEINVRLYGVAAPQTAKVDKFTGWYKAGQPYAEEAFRALSLKVLHQQVKVHILKTLVFKGGPKQVALAVVFLDGKNINLEMLADGWGWAYKEFVLKSDLPQYLAAQKLARTRKIGLWAQGNPQPPWDFKPQKSKQKPVR